MGLCKEVFFTPPPFGHPLSEGEAYRTLDYWDASDLTGILSEGEAYRTLDYRTLV